MTITEAIAERRERVKVLLDEIDQLEAAARLMGEPLPKVERGGRKPLPPITGPTRPCGHPNTQANTRRNGKCLACRRLHVANSNANAAAAAAEVEARNAPPAAPPALPASPEEPATAPRFGRGTCKAVDAESGRQCTLPAHGGVDHSASGRLFRLVLPPGGVPAPRALDQFAISRPSGTFEGAS